MYSVLFKPESVIPLTKCGLYDLPLFAIIEVAKASCRGVVNM